MDTGAHLVCNLLVQGREARPQPRFLLLVTLGAILPDLPIVYFYAWETFVSQTPEALIWSDRYFQPAWQNFIDLFNSIPLILVGLICAFGLKWHGLRIVLLGMMMHIALDLPLHNDDAHRHFFPLSDWRFESPVSYWDPRHYGRIASYLQLLLVIFGLIWLWFRYQRTFAKIVVLVLAGLYAVFLVFARLAWG